MKITLPGFSGDIITPKDTTYSQFSDSFIVKGKPAVVFCPQNTEDVTMALWFVRANNLELSVRSGGHHAAGLSTNNGGAVLDLRHLNTIEVADPAAGIVRIGPGAHWGDVAKTLEAHKLVISSGDTTSVGVGGLTLGGGLGWLVRKYGLAIDSLVAAEIVTADGQVLQLSDNENSDLFWGIKGGGGNFGVVTSFTFKAHRLPHDIYAGTVIFPLKHTKTLLTSWRDIMRSAPDELNTTLMIMPPFGERPASIMLIVCYAGDPASAKEAVSPLLALGEPTTNTLAFKPYAEILEEAGHPAGMTMLLQSALFAPFDDACIATIAASAGHPGSPMLQLRSLGGALARVGNDATAFGHRTSEVFALGIMVAPESADPQVLADMRTKWDTIAAGSRGLYANFTSTVTDADAHRAYPTKTYKKLAELKQQYDPHNLFSNTLQIAPAIKKA